MEQIPIGRPEPDNVVHLRAPQAEEPPAPTSDEAPDLDAPGTDPAPGLDEDRDRIDEIPVADRTGEAVPPSPADATPEAEEELSWEEVVARDQAGAQEPIEEPGTRANAELTALIEQIAQVGLGLTVGVADAVAGSLRRTAEETPPTDAERNEPVEVLTGAALGAAATLTELMVKVLGTAAEVVEPVASVAANPPLFGGLSRGAGSALRFLDGAWKSKEADARSSAESFMRDLVPAVTTGALEQLDLTALIRERVDINAIARDIDIDALVARVDVDAIVDRVDMDRLVERLPIDAVLARVDLDAVADRLDVDRVAERLDVSAVLARLDLAALAQEVIDEIDLPGIIRESSGAMASETVVELRVRSIGADGFVARVVDRVLGRRGRERATAVPGLTEER